VRISAPAADACTSGAEKIDARLADGVLIVRLPKSAPESAPARTRRIEITS